MTIQSGRSSRFKETQSILFGEVETYGKWAEQDIFKRQLAESELIYFVVDNTTRHRPDLIAERFYGDTQLDWVIIAFNKPRSPLNWPKTGDVIRFPSRSIVNAEVI
jgi:hypothetical protein